MSMGPIVNSNMLAMMFIEEWTVQHIRWLEERLQEPSADDGGTGDANIGADGTGNRGTNNGGAGDGSRGVDDAQNDGSDMAGHNGRDRRRLEKMAAWQNEWQEFWRDFHDACLRFSLLVKDCRDRESDFGDPLLNASPLWLLAVITPTLGLPDELWNVICLLREQYRAEIGGREAADDGAGRVPSVARRPIT